MINANDYERQRKWILTKIKEKKEWRKRDRQKERVWFVHKMHINDKLNEIQWIFHNLQNA